ncbi:unnamed protein product, partial [Ixodes pacificus]
MGGFRHWWLAPRSVRRSRRSPGATAPCRRRHATSPRRRCRGIGLCRPRDACPLFYLSLHQGLDYDGNLALFTILRKVVTTFLQATPRAARQILLRAIQFFFCDTTFFFIIT